MDMEQFKALALRTKSTTYRPDLVPVDLQHAIIGASTESGELLDAMKKAMFYGKPLDLVNVAEEVGDLMWYAALALFAIDKSFDEVCTMIIEKLKQRFPDKYSDQAADQRDLLAERAILESHTAVKAPDAVPMDDSGLTVSFAAPIPPTPEILDDAKKPR